MSNSEIQTLRDYEADRRTREVYRYFQPKNPAALNAKIPEVDEHVASIADFSTIVTPILPDDLASEIPAEVSPSSPNTTLTAFAQLAALRLNAQRAFITYIFLFHACFKSGLMFSLKAY